MFFKYSWRIGFHAAVGGNANGIGSYVQQCNNAGVPAHIKVVDGTTGISDALALPKWNAPHMLVHRTSVWKTGLPPINNPDLPTYDIDPALSALNHFNWHEQSWPPELKAQRDKVWFELINEPDRNRAEWLAEFSLNLHDIALTRGYKIAMFGWSMGEPEPEHWEGPMMLNLLRIVGDRPEDRAIALHEYSGVVDGIFTMRIGQQYIVIPRTDPNFGWLVGRFTKLHGVCDANKIRRPRIFITEFGWTLNSVPEPGVAMQHLQQAQELYNEHPNVTSAGIWYLGPGYGSIANQAQKLIAPVTNAAVAVPFEPSPYFPDPTPEPSPDDCKPRVPYSRTYNLIPQDATEERAVEIFLEGWRRSKETSGASADDALHGPGLTKVLGRLYDIPENKKAEYVAFRANYYPNAEIEFAGEVEPPPPSDPLVGLVIGPPFSDYFVLTSKFGSARDYDGDGVYDDLHEGVDYDIPGEPADSKKPVLCGYTGIVTWAGTKNTAYGNYVIVRCQNNGADFYLWYCHMDSVYVSAGQQVKRGTALGELGDTGGPWGEHIHINLQVPGAGVTGYVIADPVDPDPYIQRIIPPPTPTVRTLTGLHMTADGRPYTPDDRNNLKALKPDTITVLSMHNGSDISWAAATFPNASFVVRMFLDFGGRSISPGQFVNDTLSDTVRTISALGSAKRVIQVHNEPNLTSEGLGASWINGAAFNSWYQDVLARLRIALPSEKFIFPGLSPGGTEPGVREDSNQFLNACRPSINLSDGLGAHTYWATQRGWPMSRAIAEIDAIIAAFPGKAIWITECSNNRIGMSAQQKAVEYAQFGSQMGNRMAVKGLTYFVASASNPLYGWETNNQDNHGETWDVHMMGGLVRAEIDKLN